MDITDTTKALITPAVAQQWLTEFDFPGQRKLSRHVIDTYVTDMVHGRWRLSTLDLAVVDNTFYLINGRHRLSAVIQSGLAQTFNICMREHESLAEVKADFAAIDRGKIRLPYQIAQAMDVDQDLGLAIKHIRRLMAAVPIIAQGFRSGYNSTEDTKSVAGRIAMCRGWGSEMSLVVGSVGNTTKVRVKKIYSTPVLAVALVTFRYQPEKAELFWSGVASMEGLRAADPRYSLAEWITDHPITGSKYSQFWWAAARCWNAYMQGVPLKVIRGISQNDPLDLDGTPFTGREYITADSLPTVEEWSRKARPRPSKVLSTDSVPGGTLRVVEIKEAYLD